MMTPFASAKMCKSYPGVVHIVFAMVGGQVPQKLNQLRYQTYENWEMDIRDAVKQVNLSDCTVCELKPFLAGCCAETECVDPF